MVYYEYIFYRTYMFFFRMSAQDMPGVKAILLTGFVVLLNTVLFTNMLLNGSGHDMRQLFSPATIKLLIVAILLSVWLANYYLFWYNGRLSSTLQKFEEHTVSYNQVAASLLTAVFFILPVALFLLLAIQGANGSN
jgi:hypothetical protein